MNPLVLKTLHLAAALGVFTAMGAIVTAANGQQKKAASILHGISLLFLLLMGFALLKKPPMDQYWWMVKVVIWLFLGVAPVLAKRKVLPAPALLALCLIGGAVAAWLGMSLPKPF
ncbi:MAG: hypothetical protein EAZ65_02385 [Verrucomicrobia bacterium]|nr:MAG: hypothetical protein EAZ84_04645 [Verrucomicrobiota bacterium]TAE88896.1 MAG: hypothetical protein EAZ82_02340 [Verrucomicrobiota bacterium]TAF27313.1 MAG: hypothetical protein EAZ71_02305 [Verrucomicrobiota bacterium]TAF42396.1 MAG: hypothetical protein EAZ65_02385 [Verrucomicrobiota bacterium]